jgi:hypothetical protein
MGQAQADSATVRLRSGSPRYHSQARVVACLSGSRETKPGFGVGGAQRSIVQLDRPAAMARTQSDSATRAAAVRIAAIATLKRGSWLA